MPWCEECDDIIPDEELDGTTCPKCGLELVDPPRRPIPWTFKGMLVAAVIYLGWRTYQGITWLAHHV